MFCETKTCLVLQLILLSACFMKHCVNGIVTPELTQVPCLFIFGDSLSDNGNNNPLPTTGKANYRPYGIDFIGGPSGRFTNGLTTIDIIGKLLGFVDLIPPFANTFGKDIRKGVNYASGSAGIRDESGTSMGANVPLGQQIENHRRIISQITTKLGGLPIEANEYLKKCLYYVNIGSNDYINNYFQPQLYPTSHLYNPEQYAQLLINQFSTYLEELHSLGARKLVLVGLGQIGCTPHAIATAGLLGSCAENQNVDTLIYSHKLRALVDQFNILHLDSKSIFINSTAGTIDTSLGFRNTKAACCPLRPDGMCAEDSIPCLNRKEFVFFDGFHTTQAINELTAYTNYDSATSPGTTYPIDIKQLVLLP